MLRKQFREEWRPHRLLHALWAQPDFCALLRTQRRLHGDPQIQLRAAICAWNDSLQNRKSAVTAKKAIQTLAGHLSTHLCCAEDATHFLKPNAICVINCCWDVLELEKQLPAKMRQDLATKQDGLD